MSAEPNLRGVHISGGPGIVANLENFTAFASGDEEALNTLVVRLNALASAPWQEIVRALTTEIAAVGFDGYPSLACVKVEADRVAAFVFGESAMSIITDGRETILDGQDSSTWIDVTVHGQVERVITGSQADSQIVGVLRDGVVPAGGFMFDTVGPMPASGRWDAVMAEHHSAAPAVDPVAPIEAPVATEAAPAPEAAPVPEVAPAPEVVTSEDPAPVTEIAYEPAPDVTDTAPLPPIPEEPVEAPDTRAPEFTPEMHMLSDSIVPMAPEDPIESVTVLPNPESDIESHDATLEDTTLEHTALEHTALEHTALDQTPPDVSLDANDSAATGGLFARIDERIHPEDEPELETDQAGGADAGWSDLASNGTTDENGWSDLASNEATADDGWSDANASAGIVGFGAATQPFESPIQSLESEPALPPLPAESSPESLANTATIPYSIPQVRGVSCPNGHLTNPAHTACYSCGALIDLDAETVTGDRPILGTVTFDDGAVLSLDRPAAIGSNVPTGYEIDGELATIVRLDDGMQGVSPVHVEIRLRGWEVEIVDMESSGGTYTVMPDDRHSRTRLRSAQSAALRAGMTVETGGRSFTFATGSVSA